MFGQKVSPAKPTPEESSNFANLILKTSTAAHLTIDPAKTQELATAQRKLRDADDLKNRPDGDWRSELSYLDRLLSGRFTFDQAKQHASDALQKFDGDILTIEGSLSKLRAAQETQFLSAADRRIISTKISRLTSELDEARTLRERSIRANGASISACKLADALRPRWAELKKREWDLSNATNTIREL